MLKFPLCIINLRYYVLLRNNIKYTAREVEKKYKNTSGKVEPVQINIGSWSALVGWNNMYIIKQLP